jgi:hypothetical protein
MRRLNGDGIEQDRRLFGGVLTVVSRAQIIPVALDVTTYVFFESNTTDVRASSEGCKRLVNRSF